MYYFFKSRTLPVSFITQLHKSLRRPQNKLRTFCIATKEIDNKGIRQKHADPIIEKYSALNNVAPLSEDFDKVYLTKYGTIRLDTDNPALETTCQKQEPREMNIAESSQDETLGINEINNNANEHLSDSITSPPIAEDLNYVDEFYFNNNNNNNNKIHSPSLPPDVNNITSSTIDYQPCGDVQSSNSSELNYIDDQYFGSVDNNTVSEDDLHSDKNGGQYVDDMGINSPSNIADNKYELYRFEDSLIIKPSEISTTFYKGLTSHKERTAPVSALPKPEKIQSITKKVPEQHKKFATDSRKVNHIPSNTTDTNSQTAKEADELKKKKLPEDSALAFVQKLRKEANSNETKLPIGYLQILYTVPNFQKCTKYDIIKELSSRIIYNENDIIAIDKPYGIPAHGGGAMRVPIPSVVELLPELADMIGVEKLYPVHRLDAITTGILLLAKTEEMADDLKLKFSQQKIKKAYLAIVKGVPKDPTGVIDIPIEEGSIGNVKRMCLRPDVEGFRGKTKGSKKAITIYKVLSGTCSASFVELIPNTGVKHQLRVHLGFGLNCPILGDHKYSHLTRLAPQKLPGDLLDYLKMEQSKVRKLPTFLHARYIRIPEINGKSVWIRADLPKFFRVALTKLKLSKSAHSISGKPSEYIFDDDE